MTIDASERRVTIPEDVWVSLRDYVVTERAKYLLVELTPSAVVIGMVRNRLIDTGHYPPPSEQRKRDANV